MALEAALQQRDFDAFAAVIKNLATARACTGAGIVDGSWWTLKGGGCPDFAVCYACFAGVFWMRGLDGFLMRATPPPGEAILCSFHPTHPRFKQCFDRLYESVDKGVFSILEGHPRKVTGIRVCGKNTSFVDSKWWGYLDARFCEDCYVTYVKDTTLGAHLPVQGEVVDASTFCQIWSPRMRGYWDQVCASGRPGSPESVTAVHHFRIIAKTRYESFFQTLSEIETMKQSKGIQRKTAYNNALMSIQSQGMAGMLAAAGQQSEYQYGNSSVGWYGSSAALESRLLYGKFLQGLSDSQFHPSEIQRVLALQKIWNEVE